MANNQECDECLRTKEELIDYAPVLVNVVRLELNDETSKIRRVKEKWCVKCFYELLSEVKKEKKGR